MHEVLLTTPKFRVERRLCRTPDGVTIKREVIAHPGAVAILPILDDCRVVMIRNFRFTANQELWELPAGTLNPGESPLDCARRELEEETGYTAASMVPLGEFYTSPGFTDERMHVFTATGLSLGRQKLDEHEHIAVELIELERARRMLIDARLRDGKTIAALGMYLLQKSP